VARVEAALGPVEVLVNNAGITRDAMLHKMSFEQWKEVLDVNLGGCFNMCRAIIGGMRERRFGRIVNLGSVNGLSGQAGQTNYAATKAGLIGFTKSLALEGAARCLPCGRLEAFPVLHHLHGHVLHGHAALHHFIGRGAGLRRWRGAHLAHHRHPALHGLHVLGHQRLALLGRLGGHHLAVHFAHLRHLLVRLHCGGRRRCGRMVQLMILVVLLAVRRGQRGATRHEYKCRRSQCANEVHGDSLKR
jgi:hypothetical protein